MTFPRQRRTTLVFMTALALIAAVGTALCVGYHFGRRAGSKPSDWKKRTSRVVLGRLAINLLVLMAARRVRQRFQARVFCDGRGIWGLRYDIVAEDLPRIIAMLHSVLPTTDAASSGWRRYVTFILNAMSTARPRKLPPASPISYTPQPDTRPS